MNRVGYHPPVLPRALLVDLDDTLIDDSSMTGACWDAACAGAGMPGLREAVAAAIAHFWSDPERHRIGRLDLAAARRLIVGDALAGMGRPDPGLARSVADRYSDLRSASSVLLPGAREALAGLRDRGVRMVLVTNGASAVQRSKIDRFGLASFFEEILVEGEVGYGKPDERIYRRGLEAVGATAAEAWIAGDNLEWEVAVPKRLGFTTVWVDHRGRGLPENPPAVPDRVVRGLGELLR